MGAQGRGLWVGAQVWGLCPGLRIRFRCGGQGWVWARGLGFHPGLGPALGVRGSGVGSRSGSLESMVQC